MPGIKITSYIAPSVQTGAFTFAVGQEVSGVVINSASDLLAAIPLDTDAAFPVGAQIPIIRIGAGQPTFSPVSGITLYSADNKRKLRAVGSPGVLWKIAANTWVLSGDLAT